jgi:hypothetical protein
MNVTVNEQEGPNGGHKPLWVIRCPHIFARPHTVVLPPFQRGRRATRQQLKANVDETDTLLLARSVKVTMVRVAPTIAILFIVIASKTSRVNGQTPAPSVAGNSPTIAPDRCNICGFGNSITNPAAIVTFLDHAFKERSLSCGDLQELANADDTPFPVAFCDELRDVAFGGGCGCVMPNGTAVTLPPTLFPTPAVTTPQPTYPEGTIVLAPTLAPVIVTPTVPPGGKCFLCGAEGNSIGSPDESFTFTDTETGGDRTLGCAQAQDLLDTGDAPAGWCEAVQKAAIETCTCLDSSGSPLVGGPTVSPNDRDCWICGKSDGVANIMGDGNAVVDYYDHENVLRKFPCKELARLASDTIAVPLAYCDKVIEQALEPCRCATPEGDLISDLMYPTLSPADGGKPATPHYAGLDDSDGDDEEGGGADGEGNGNSTLSDPDNSGGSGGGSSAVSNAGVRVGAIMTLLVSTPFVFAL